DDATVVLDRSTILGALGVTHGSHLLTRNTIMNGVQADAGTTLDILYSTLVNERGSSVIQCSSEGPSAVTVRNSLLLPLAEDAEPLSPGCAATVRYSASHLLLEGNTNTLLGPVDG